MTNELFFASGSWHVTVIQHMGRHTTSARGYQFIHGGPYDPADEIPARFAKIVDDALIGKVVEDLHGEVGDQWAPIRQSSPNDDYDERFDLSIYLDEPLSRLQGRVRDAQQLLTLSGER
jgi:hypothetical protein